MMQLVTTIETWTLSAGCEATHYNKYHHFIGSTVHTSLSNHMIHYHTVVQNHHPPRSRHNAQMINIYIHFVHRVTDKYLVVVEVPLCAPGCPYLFGGYDTTARRRETTDNIDNIYDHCNHQSYDKGWVIVDHDSVHHQLG